MTAGGRIVRVVVVDDQFPFRDAARAVVDRMDGFEVIAEADSGEAAIELVAELQPDLVLMDIKMGGIDGIAAATAMTASDSHPMVVLLSTYELNDLPPAARTSGAAAYINKDDFGGRILKRLWEEGGDPSFPRS